MGQANASPEELEAFAGALGIFLETVDNAVGQMSSSFSQLSGTWHDVKFQQFEEVYQKLLAELANFRESANEQIPHLHRMAEDLKTYLLR
jgi:uncharacterized protein YukE